MSLEEALGDPEALLSDLISPEQHNISAALTAQTTALGAYVVLLVHLRRGAEERDRKLHVLRPANERDPQGIGPGVPAAAATGRYTHPSYQAAAAH